MSKLARFLAKELVVKYLDQAHSLPMKGEGYGVQLSCFSSHLNGHAPCGYGGGENVANSFSGISNRTPPSQPSPCEGEGVIMELRLEFTGHWLHII